MKLIFQAFGYHKRLDIFVPLCFCISIGFCTLSRKLLLVTWLEPLGHFSLAMMYLFASLTKSLGELIILIQCTSRERICILKEVFYKFHVCLCNCLTLPCPTLFIPVEPEKERISDFVLSWSCMWMKNFA